MTLPFTWKPKLCLHFTSTYYYYISYVPTNRPTSRSQDDQQPLLLTLDIRQLQPPWSSVAFGKIVQLEALTVENLSQKSHVVVVDDKTSGKQYSICTDCLHTDLAFDDQNWRKTRHGVCVFHSSQIRGLCLMKLSSETHQNLPYFWQRGTELLLSDFFKSYWFV